MSCIYLIYKLFWRIFLQKSKVNDFFAQKHIKKWCFLAKNSLKTPPNPALYAGVIGGYKPPKRGFWAPKNPPQEGGFWAILAIFRQKSGFFREIPHVRGVKKGSKTPILPNFSHFPGGPPGKSQKWGPIIGKSSDDFWGFFGKSPKNPPRGGVPPPGGAPPGGGTPPRGVPGGGTPPLGICQQTSK